MKLLQLLKLSHADFLARRKVITLSVLAASVPFVIFLLINFLAAGVERVMLNETGKASDGAVYLMISSNNPKRELETVFRYRGELISQITSEQAAQYDSLTDFMANLPAVPVNRHLLTKAEEANGLGVEFMPWDSTMGLFKDFHLTNVFLSSIATYYLPFHDLDDLQAQLKKQAHYIVKFPNMQSAYKAYATRCKKVSSCSYQELTDNAFRSYVNFHSNEDFLLLLEVVFMFIAAVIAIGTYVYLLDQSMHTMVIYRALGANTVDLFIIALGFIIEVSLCVIISSLAIALLLALIISGVDAGRITKLFTDFYGYAPDNTILIGFNLQIIWIILVIFLTAPLSLILTLDQFSVKRLSRKLKRD